LAVAPLSHAGPADYQPTFTPAQSSSAPSYGYIGAEGSDVDIPVGAAIKPGLLRYVVEPVLRQSGALTALASGTLDLGNIAGTGGIIFTLAVTFYKTYFQATELNQQLTGGSPRPQSAAKSTFTRTAGVWASSRNSAARPRQRC